MDQCKNSYLRDVQTVDHQHVFYNVESTSVDQLSYDTVIVEHVFTENSEQKIPIHLWYSVKRKSFQSLYKSRGGGTPTTLERPTLSGSAKIWWWWHHAGFYHEGKLQILTKREIDQAMKPFLLQGMLGLHHKGILSIHRNMITNCSITAEDITNVYKIFGQNLADMKRKEVRQKPERVVMEYMAVQKIFHYKNIWHCQHTLYFWIVTYFWWPSVKESTWLQLSIHNRGLQGM